MLADPRIFCLFLERAQPYIDFGLQTQSQFQHLMSSADVSLGLTSKHQAFPGTDLGQSGAGPHSPLASVSCTLGRGEGER